MKKAIQIASLILIIISIVAFRLVKQDEIVIYLVGDSTCAEKDADAFPEMGWGVPFVTFFNDQVRVENHAKNGRSTKSFIEEGRWEAVMNTLKAGDYVFIQFGHNDEVPSKVGRYTTPVEYKANLIKYIRDAQSKGAIPVLLTPVSRRSFEVGVLIDSHLEYAQLMRDVASENKIPIIDMTKKSMDLVNDLGEEKSVLIYHHLQPGEHPNYPNGKADDTHFNELGARKMAQLVLDGIQELQLGLVDYIVVGKR